MMMVFGTSREQRDKEKADDGLPAQLHKEYSPPSSRKAAYERASKNSALKYHGEAVADETKISYSIVLVHGLASKYETTWAYKRKDGSRFHWIRHRLPEDVPDCRILGFEYPSRWYSDPVHTDLTECAFELLRCLIRSRCHQDKQTMCDTRKKRPIILIGHSFGGLVIKKMMVLASLVLSTNSCLEEFETHRDLLSAISGVVFLGTPHRGSSFALLAGLKIGFGKYVMSVSSNDEIIRILKPESYVLDDLQDQFSTLCGDKRVSGLKLFCYYEMKEVPILKKLVVTKDASCLDNAASRGMSANHMEMNTFPEGSDFNYDHFIADVLMLCHESAKTIPKRFEGWRYGSNFPDAEREQLQSSLAPSHDQPTFYKINLEKHRAAPYTCSWIHQVPAFNSWKTGSAERNALWISGKAGSGKSVLTSYIIHSLLHQDGGDESAMSCVEALGNPYCGFDRRLSPVLYFICGIDRAHEKPERMLATFIHQLLLQCPENEELIHTAFELYENKLGGVSASEMADMLQELVSLITSPVYIVVDGLEEIAKPEMLIENLVILRSSANMRFLFVSQEDKVIANSLEWHFDIKQPVLITDYSYGDITSFIKSKCEYLMQKQPQLKEKEDFLAKYTENESRGMFQWVNAVFDGMGYVTDPKDMEKKLDGMGKDLIGTYDKVFERFGSREDPDWESRIRVALQFLAVCATSVSPAAVKFACDMKQRPEDTLSLLLNPGDERIASEGDIAEKHIRELLGSAVDVTYDGTVRLQHGSMLKALTRVDTASQNTVAAKFKFTEEEAHFEVSLICMRICRATTFSHANSFTPSRPPLVEYAWNYWGYHLNKSGMTFLTGSERDQIMKLVSLHPGLKDPVAQQQKLQDAFDRMIEGVTRDALLYLEALVYSLCRPLKAAPGHFSDREYVLSLQRAQESLIEPTRDICSLRRMGPPSYKLHNTRKEVEDVLAKNVNEAVTAMDNIQGAAEAVSEVKSQILGDSSSIKRLHLDSYLKEHPNLPMPTQSSKLLLDVARNLRLVAVRFAVDPIYSSLLISAGGSTFSPLHPLIYVAQLLEESGRYPYWGKHPPATDLMEHFSFCPSDDPEHSAAQFVLHCFEWRDMEIHESDDDDNEKVLGRYVPATQTAVALATRPCPSGHEFTRVPTENLEQVRRLHQMSAERFWFARTAYSVFGSDNENIREYVTKPLSHLHMRYSLSIDEFHHLPDREQEIEFVLDQYAPLEAREKPLETYLRSLPYQVRTMMVKYLMYILHFWGGLAHQAMAIHFTRIEIARGEISQVRQFFGRVNWRGRPGPVVNPPVNVAVPPDGVSGTDAAGVINICLPPVSRKHILYALPFFLLRCIYFPSWGSFVWFHSWSNISMAYKHPATYVDLQNDLGFWALLWTTLWTTLRYSIYTVVANAAVVASNFPITIDGETNTADVEILGHASYIYSAFHHLCAVDRSLFSVANFLATIYACSIMMFYDTNTLANLLRHSLLFWFNVILGIVSSAMHLGVQQSGGGLGGLIFTMLIQFGLFYFALRHSIKLMNILVFLFTPVTATAMFLWRNAMFASVVAAKATGGICLLLLTLKCLGYMHKFVWDPYDVEESLEKLLQASKMVMSALTIEDRRQLKRIGWYPLGEKPVQPSTNVIAEAWTESGPPRAVPPLAMATSALDINVNGGMENALRGVKQYFEDGTWTRHMGQIGSYIDSTVLGIDVGTTGVRVGLLGDADGSAHVQGMFMDNVASGLGPHVRATIDPANGFNEALPPSFSTVTGSGAVPADGNSQSNIEGTFQAFFAGMASASPTGHSTEVTYPTNMVESSTGSTTSHTTTTTTTASITGPFINRTQRHTKTSSLHMSTRSVSTSDFNYLADDDY